MPRRLPIIAAVLLAACQANPTAVLTNGPAKDQTLRVELPGALPGRDPAKAPVYDAGVVRLTFEPLLNPKPDLTDVQAGAAESYTVSSDGLTYTFLLQKAGRWSDGTPVTAADFVRGWRRVLDPRTSSPAAPALAGEVKGGGAYSSLDPKDDVAKIPGFLDGLGFSAPDVRTFTVQLAQPSPYFKWVVTMPETAPELDDLTIGNGAFQVVPGQPLTLLPNRSHWGPRPKLAKILLEADGVARYRAGQAELAAVTMADAAGATGDVSLTGQLLRQPLLRTFWLQFNVNRPPFDNPRVRQAVSQAIDRTALTRDVLKGTAVPAQALLPRGTAGYDGGLSPQAYGGEGARNTLDASGEAAADLTDVHLLVRDTPGDRAVADFAAAQVRQHLGLDLRLDVLPSPQVTAKLAAGDYQVEGPAGWFADYPDPQDWFDIFLSTSWGEQWSHYTEPAFDRLVNDADRQADPARRATEYRQAQQLLAEDAPVAFLYQSQELVLRQPYVQGITLTGLDDWPGDLQVAGVSLTSH
ncbi:MAG: peptide ABC transporter substrate-binding protein [Chloroflexi bacterium]|nr:MAG: peptide ABC transporter substrate-binding protein [Chloroflexota bacterium]